MLRKYFFISTLLSLFVTESIAQTEDLPLHISIAPSINNDSLWFSVTAGQYKKPSSLMFTASLASSKLTDTFFLPVVDPESVFCLVIPPGTKEDLMVRGYFSPGIFTISGKINTYKRQSAVKAILITDNNKFFNKEIVLDEANMFSLPPLVFQDKATLAFNYANSGKSKDHPDVTLNHFPFSLDFAQLIFSQKINRSAEAGKTSLDGTTDTSSTIKTDLRDTGKYKLLREIKVTGIKKTGIEKFNETYSTGLFNDPGERIIDCLDNKTILAFSDCMSYLQTRIAGLSVSTGHYGDMIVKWHGHEMKIFYIDEIQVDLEQLLGVNPADIAMIKVYSPPFLGASGNGDGGAVAIYTRRGEYRTQETNKWLFMVKGYASPIHTLFGGK